jgi:regulator of cell morphogenesis and NO signaling
MLILKDMKLADVIHHDHNLVPIINRFDIHLGFGDKTIGELTREQDINTDFFLVILNAFHDPQYFPRKHLQSFPASMLIHYLTKSHDYYLEKKIPEIEYLIDNLTEEDGMDNDTFLLLKNFFKEYKEELMSHIRKEEERVYPYVLELERAIEELTPSESLISQMNAYSINDYEDEHDDVEDKLYDLKNILIKYVPTGRTDANSYKILHELFLLESDLNDHSRIEDLILVPKVEAMEFTLKTMNS